MTAAHTSGARRHVLVRAWFGVAVLVLGAYAAHLAVGQGRDGLDGFFNDWVQNALLANGGLLCLMGARRRERRAPWLLLAAGLGMWALGNIVWSVWFGQLDQPPYPSVSDALWLAYYPLTYVALVLLVRDRVEHFRASVWLDGLIGGLGSAALAAAVLWPTLSTSGGGTAAVAVNLAYPLADVLLLAVLAASLSLTGIRPDRGLALFSLGMLLNAVADGTYLLRIADGWGDGPSLLDPLWVAAQLCMGAAAWQRVPAQPRRLEGWRLMVLPATFAVAGLAVLVWGAAQSLPLVPCALAVATIAAAATRAGMTYGENAQLMHARREARTDDLTGLANRRELYTRLESLLGDGSRPVALLLFDLDGFKELNDALGHHAGDELLKELAVRLHRSLPQADLLVRLGGDEFVALLTPAGHNEAIAAGTAIRELLGSSFRLGSTDVHVQASIGIALAPEHGHTRTALLMHADVAMYRAKRSGTGVEVHDATVRLPDADHLQLASDLHGAIPEGQLAVYFQPKADLATGRLTGAEALIRWLHPERGLLGPDAFLPLAERHGLMHELTATVLDEALAQQAAWRASGLAIPVSVNLARASLLDDGFPTSVAAALERHGATPADLILEITEDTVMVDADRTLAVLDGLRALGVPLALDDFGTGHSSLAYVKRLPIDELKIDKSFVRSMTSDHRDEAIVEAAARLGLRFGMRVVAEGVEDPATWARLKALGCHEAQGFLLAQPMPAAAFLAFARDHGAAQAA